LPAISIKGFSCALRGAKKKMSRVAKKAMVDFMMYIYHRKVIKKEVE